MKVLGSRCATSCFPCSILKSALILVLAAPLGSSALPAVANAQTLATKDPEAVAIAQRSLAAMGGTTILANVKDSQAEGTITYSALKASFSIVLKTNGTKKLRVEMQRQNGTYVRILNGGYAVVAKPDGTIRRLTTHNTVGERVTHIPLFSLLAEQSDPNIDVLPRKATGTSLPARDAFVLQLASGQNQDEAAFNRKLTATTYFSDPVSGFISKMSFINFAEKDVNAEIPVEVIYSDYRNISGVMVPFRQTTYANSKLESELVLTSVAFNVGLPDSEFDLPAEVANAH